MRASHRLIAILVAVAAVLLPVAAGLAMAITPPSAIVTRLSGADRYATNAAVVAAAFTGPVTNAVVVNGTDWPDLIIADSIAGKLGAPVLLVTRDRLPSGAAAQLGILKPAHIYVFGGVSLVSAAVLVALRADSANPLTIYAGADRYATAAQALTATYGAGGGAGVFADDDWHANLYAGYCGAIAQVPIVPVAPLAVSPLLPPAIAALLTHLTPQGGGMVGDRISAAVAAKVETYFANPIGRLPGPDDYSIELSLSQDCNAGPTAPLFLASGQSYPDSLGAGGSIAALHGNLLLLDGRTVSPALMTLLRALRPSQVYVLGGATLLSDRYVATVTADLGAPGP